MTVNITNAEVRLATVQEEPELLHLIQIMHAESGWRPLDIERAREFLATAFERRGGIIAVIGGPGRIRAMLAMTIACAWYTSANHLEETFCWVHPEHRQSDYAKLLINYAKKCSDDISHEAGFRVPLLMGVLTHQRMAAKVRLYRRFFGLPVGAFFVHNADWVSKVEPSAEDFWRLPSIAKWFRRTNSRDAGQRVKQSMNG